MPTERTNPCATPSLLSPPSYAYYSVHKYWGSTVCYGTPDSIVASTIDHILVYACATAGVYASPRPTLSVLRKAPPTTG